MVSWLGKDWQGFCDFCDLGLILVIFMIWDRFARFFGVDVGYYFADFHDLG